MSDEKWEVVDEVAGELQAELIRGLLEAQEIKVVLSQEGIGRVYATTVGAFGRVQILVSAKDEALARQILDQYYSSEPSDELSGDDQSQDTPES
jgi:hypothetical protein